ncbi:MAG: hypothetical protein ABIJ39_02560 [Chloroflexota bacterium]
MRPSSITWIPGYDLVWVGLLTVAEAVRVGEKVTVAVAAGGLVAEVATILVAVGVGEAVTHDPNRRHMHRDTVADLTIDLDGILAT